MKELETIYSTLADIFYNSIQTYLVDKGQGQTESNFITLFSDGVKTFAEVVSDNMNHVYELPFSLGRYSYMINVKDIVNKSKYFFSKNIKSIYIDVNKNTLSFKIVNSEYNSLNFNFVGEPINDFVLSDFVNKYEDIINFDINKYVVDTKNKMKVIYSSSTYDFYNLVLMNSVEKMVRLQFDLLSAHTIESGPVLVIREYTKQELKDQIDNLENMKKVQEEFYENLSKNNSGYPSIDYLDIINKDLEKIKSFYDIMNEDKTVHVATNITVFRKPDFGDEEYNNVILELIDRIYMTQDLRDNDYVLYTQELFYLTKFEVIEDIFSSNFFILYNNEKNMKMFLFDFRDGRRIYGYLPCEINLQLDRKNLVIVIGMREEPNGEGLTEERLNYIYDVLFTKKFIDRVTNKEKYNIEKLKEEHAYMLYDSYHLIEQLKPLLSGQSWFDNWVEELEKLRKQIDMQKSFAGVFRNILEQNRLNEQKYMSIEPENDKMS